MMMTRYSVFSALLLLVYSARTQNVLWAMNSGQRGASSTNLASDSRGNFYHYGLSYNVSPQSFIEKYDHSGKLQFAKVLTGNVKISGMTCANNVMLVCGTFSGQVVIDGQSLQSNGRSDGFIASMDNQGYFSWLSIINGSGCDMAASLAWDPIQSRVLATGMVQDNFLYNGNTVESASEKSMFLAELDLMGNVLRHKLYDFRSGDTSGNMGIGVQTDAQGNLYLLHQREGRIWSDDSSTDPEEGIYLSGLDANLDPSWSSFIINKGCYYGYSCERLASGSGECFVPSYCSGKYGGTGLLRSFDPSGTITSTISNTDGSFADLCASGEDLFAVATVSANGCPCESNNPGMRAVQRISAGNREDVFLLDGRQANLTNITVTSSGLLVVSGYFNESQLQVGPYTLVNSGVGTQGFIFALGAESQITGIAKTGAMELSVYPNPTSGDIVISGLQGPALVKVTDMMGHTIYERQVSGPQGDAALRVYGLPAGPCVVTATSGEMREVRKVIVRR